MRTMRLWMCGLLYGVMALCGSPVEAEQSAQIALLPLEGQPAQSFKLPKFVEAVARRLGRPVLSPKALRHTLRRTPAVADSIRRARKLARRAEDALLHMRGPKAAALAGRALILLDRTGGWIHASELKGRLHLVQAQGHLLPPMDLDATRASLAAGHRVQGVLRRGDLPPRLKRMVGIALDKDRRVAPPSIERVAQVIALAQVHALVWVGLSAKTGNELQVDVHTFERGKAAWSKPRRHRFSSAQAPILTAQAIADQLSPIFEVPRPSPLHVDNLPNAKLRPWYKRWWFWALAGLATGAVVGTVAIIQGQASSDPGLRLRFEFR